MTPSSFSAFSDELQKIAEQKEKTRKARLSKPERLGIMLGATGLTLGAKKGARHLANDLVKREQGGYTSISQMRALRDAIHPGAKIFPSRHGGLESALNIPKGGILSKRKRVDEVSQYIARKVPDSVIRTGLREGVSIAPVHAGPHVAAHELGHSAFGATQVGTLLRKARLDGLTAPIGTFGANIMASRDPDSRASKMAPWVGAMSVAPVLVDEALASLKGYKAMKNLGYTAQELSTARGTMARAFGTYGLSLGVPAVGGPLLQRAIRKYYKRRNEERRPS